MNINKILVVSAVAVLGTALSIQISGTSGSAFAASSGSEAALPELAELSLPKSGQPYAVEDNYTIIEDQLFNENPEDWGGAYIDDDYLVVKTVTYDVDQAAAILRDLGVTESVRIQEAAVSLSDLDEAVDELVSSHAGQFSSVGPEYSQSRIVVGLDSEHHRETIGEWPKSINDIPVEKYSHTIPTQTSRYYGTSPYYGGMAINLKSDTGSSVLCSTGFTWDSPNSGHYLVTASHCARSNSHIRQQVLRYNSGGGTSTIGKVVWKSGGANGTLTGRKGDVAVIKLSSGSAAARVFNGSYNTTSSRKVIGPTALAQGWQGSKLYTSGASGLAGNGSGMLNPDWISLVNQTIYYSPQNQTYKNLTVAEHASDCINKGDSGGAYYFRLDSGDVRGVGIVSGTNNSGDGWANCRNYYSPLTNVKDGYGGKIKRG